ncbi:MAG: LacI family DNA-binding transcriptional regulator [Chloroflexi bacterium]|nr:LacI family DNA-binding transcriptional regulator [Chloroflexota bacterium]
MPGDRQVTIADIARATNVSRTLVSFVLNGRKDVAPATRARILQAIEELGYRPNSVARNLAKRRAGAIGIVCDMETYQDPLDMQFLAAILATTSEMGQRVMLIPADDRQIQEVAQDHAVDGIIFLDERVSDPRIADLLAMGIPAVGLWGDHLDATFWKGIDELALHLESRGLQRVVCLYEASDKLFVAQFKRILSNALRQHEIETTDCHCPHEAEAAMAHTIVNELKRNGATAILASSDKLAISAIHGLHSARLRVPVDCAVAGFGDVPAAQWVQPQLTTIRVPVRVMAQWAVAKVFEAAETNHRQVEHNAVSCRLIVRRSC